MFTKNKNQKTYCFGEVLYDIFQNKKQPGGAPMNVAIGMQKLGMQACLISKIGDDDFGKDILKWLNEQQLETEHIQIDKENYPTGKVLVSTNTNGENAYEIVQPAAWDFIEPISICKDAFNIVFGSLACRNNTSYNTLKELIKQAELKIFDVNLRSPFYDPTLINELLKCSDWVKMNADEIYIIAEWLNIITLTFEEQMLCIVAKYGIDLLMVTKGSKGASVLYQNVFFHHQGFVVEVKNTVGSGDAFLAGFLKMFLTQQNISKALHFACACGAFVALHQGANPQFNEDDILKIQHQ